MVFEWGTFDTEKTLGSLKALQQIIVENQGYQYGYVNNKQESKIKENVLEAYYPASEAWRSVVMESGRSMQKEALGPGKLFSVIGIIDKILAVFNSSPSSGQNSGCFLR